MLNRKYNDAEEFSIGAVLWRWKRACSLVGGLRRFEGEFDVGWMFCVCLVVVITWKIHTCANIYYVLQFFFLICWRKNLPTGHKRDTILLTCCWKTWNGKLSNAPSEGQQKFHSINLISLQLLRRNKQKYTHVYKIRTLYTTHTRQWKFPSKFLS